MKNMKLFPKTFIHCLTLIISVLLTALLLLYIFLPTFYRQYKQKKISEDTSWLASELGGISVSNLPSALSGYAINKGYGYTAEYENGDIICNVSAGIGFAFSEIDTGDDFSVNVDMELAESRASFHTVDGKTVILIMNTSLQPIDDAVSVLLLLIPPLLLICIILSALVSWIYARSIVKPVKAITDATVQMTSLSPDISCKVTGRDEIGILSQNINEMYKRLLFAISDLERQIDAVGKAEQEKLDFLLLASHELKTPVTAVRGMVDGMLYNVGVYKDRERYLLECQRELEHLTDLLCRILESSKMDISAAARNTSDTDIGDLLKRVSMPYLAIAQSREIRITVNTENTLFAVIPAELIEKVFSNIFSNAVKYTDSGKSICIYIENNAVIIENECAPLTAEELSHIGEPFYRPSNTEEKHNDGTGLGLYFTDKLLSACGLSYSFSPYEKGMRFILNF